VYDFSGGFKIDETSKRNCSMTTNDDGPKLTNITPFTGGKRHKKPPTEAPIEITEPPDFLSEGAKQHFRETAKALAEMQILADSDVPALAMYAETYQIRQDALEIVAEEGLTLTSPRNGFLIQHPALGIANTAQDRCLKMMKEFGLTPASRKRIMRSLARPR
jgi:P27 family predicted phage terminase small subunit